MNAPPLPPNETDRLDALAQYNILDTATEPAFDDLARLAAQWCQTPIAFIGLVDRDRVWLKSRIGWDLAEVPRRHSVCSWAILEDRLFVVDNLTEDPRFASNPFVTGPPRLRFCAAMPLKTGAGFHLGTLCVLHHAPHRLDAHQREALEILARQVVTQLELRRGLAELARAVQEHQAVEQQLKDSESFYQALVESLPQNIIRKDVQGRFTFANDKFCQSIGKSREALLGKTDFDLFPNELASKYHRDDLRVMATRENLDTVEAHQSRQGEKMFVHVIKTLLYDAQGNVAGIQGIFWDVTHRKRIEEALAYERDLLRALLDNIPDRIYFKDVQSRFLRCSASMVRRLGLTDPKEVVGKTDFDFRPMDRAQEYYDDEQRIILTGQPLINKHEQQLDLQGNTLWASVTKVPIYNQAGAVTGIIGITRDITQLKKTEKELEMARDAALESARVKSQFLANMSHEIRTPMNAITGMTELLKDTSLSPEQREYTDIIGHSTATLLSIINEILDYSKIEAGKLALESINFPLRETVENTGKMLADLAQTKGLELGVWIDPSIPDGLRGDPDRLRQILSNLLSNAIKFTEKGEVVIRVTPAPTQLEENDAPDRAMLRLLFSVKDTGIGIHPDAIHKIFEAFTQADGSTTRKFGGTGLGLTITRQLVELMGGTLGVESQPNHGATFQFTLRLHLQDSPGSVPWIQSPDRLAGRHILIADDSALCRHILVDLLRSWNARPVEADTHRKAVQLLTDAARNNDPFHLLLLDLEMPDANGLNLASRLQADPSTRAVALVALTTYRCGVELEAMRRAGFAGRLLKPIRQARLWDCLTRSLNGGVPEDDAAESGTQRLSRRFSGPPQAAQVRILLAEDNLVNQRVALSQLKKLGYSADAVSNGAKVLEAMWHNDYQIILMDCQMPEMDGYEVTRRIRRMESGPEARWRSKPFIIALTANSLDGDRDRCLQAGMNDYLTKPIEIHHLDAVLQRALSLTLSTRTFPPASSPLPAQPPAPAGLRQDDPPTGQVLDPRVLDGLRQLESTPEINPLADLIGLYLADAKNRFDIIDAALAAKDPARLAASIHALKGSSNNLGARQLGDLCGQVEKLAKSDQFDAAARLVPAVKTEFDRVRDALQREIA